MLTYLIIFLGFIISAQPGSPPHSSNDDFSFEENLNIGIEAFYNTDWERASEVFELMKAEKPNDPRAYFFESMMPFLEYFFVDQSEELAGRFLEKSERAVELSRRQLNENPSDTTMVLMLSGLHGYRGLVAAGQNQHRIALTSGLTGFNYTRRLLSIDSERPDARIGRGMFYYMVGSVPSGMRWATNMVGLRADVEDGFSELKAAAESESYIQNDAKMMLMYLYAKENRLDEALHYAELLTNKLPDNVIFLYKKAEILEQLNNINEAINVYNSIIEKNNKSVSSITRKSEEKIKELEKLTSNK